MSTALILSYVALWVLVILLSLVLLGVVRLVHQLQQENKGEGRSRIGRKAPKFQAVDLAGARVGTESFAGQLRALLFISPSCQSCTASLDEIALLKGKAEGNVIVICQANRAECADMAARFDLDGHVVADESGRIGKRFEVSAHPTAVLLDEDDRIQSYGAPLRKDQSEDIVAQGSPVEPAGVA